MATCLLIVEIPQRDLSLLDPLIADMPLHFAFVKIILYNLATMITEPAQ